MHKSIGCRCQGGTLIWPCALAFLRTTHTWQEGCSTLHHEGCTMAAPKEPGRVPDHPPSRCRLPSGGTPMRAHAADAGRRPFDMNDNFVASCANGPVQ